MAALYACPDCSTLPDLAGDDDWVSQMFSDDELDAFITNVKKGKYKEGGTDRKRVKKYAEKLTEAVEKGFGKTIAQVDYDTPDAVMLRKLAENVFHFSAAKNRAEIISLSEALVDPKTGKLRTFEQFRGEAAKILDEFQGSWLRTEYNMAVGASTMAARWMEYSANPDAILVYRTAGDARVRDAHQLLNGIAKRVSDPFWDTYYPPNGWNCRCDVETTDRKRQTGGDAPAGAIDGVPDMFRTNFAKAGLALPPDHPYLKKGGGVVLRWGQAAYRTDGPAGKPRVWETEMKYRPTKSTREQFRKEKELEQRQTIARQLADKYKTDFYIPPALKGNADPRYGYFYKDAKGGMQPDLYGGGHWWEVESYEGKFQWSKLSKMLSNGGGQADRLVLAMNDEVDVAECKRRIKGYLKANKDKGIKKVLVRTKDGKLVEVR